jgi:dihydropteroate synthase
MHDSTAEWICRKKRISFRNGALLMGILNVTPDSFSDGGRYADKQRAIERAAQIAEEGADIIDVGGESSRPGALPVEDEVELNRVMPVIEYLSAHKKSLISVDTRKSSVAEAAMRAGAQIINDISALESDPRMVEVAHRFQAGLILMHKKGEPLDMQENPRYKDVVSEVSVYLKKRVATLTGQGIERRAMAVDPGIGFGKTVRHNLQLIASIAGLRKSGRPVVVGLSRKSFLGRLTGRPANERLAGGLAAFVYCILNGVNVLRVHDVKESRDALVVLNAIYKARTAC